MANLLTPPGFIGIHKYIYAPIGVVSNASSDPMPPRPGCLIRTEKGVCRLQTTEYCRGLGFTNKETLKATSQLASTTTSIYHWEYLSPVLLGTVSNLPTPIPIETIPVVYLISSSLMDAPPSFDFIWRPPDLTVEGQLYNERVENLRRTCAYYDDAEELLDDKSHFLASVVVEILPGKLGGVARRL